MYRQKGNRIIKCVLTIVGKVEAMDFLRGTDQISVRLLQQIYRLFRTHSEWLEKENLCPEFNRKHVPIH